MTTSVEQLADELVRQLTAAGRTADRFTTGPDSAGVNVWGGEARYPAASITISHSVKFHDYAWGHSYEYTLPITTPPADVADAVLKTLHDEHAGVETAAEEPS